MSKLILDLCAGSGAWSQPYVDAGYEVRRITLPDDIRLEVYRREPIWGLLAAPPCTMFSSSGARWPRSKDDYLDALSVVDACLRIVALHPELRWWALENPVGTLTRWLGPPVMYFHPCQYGDPYTKKTALWGRFTPLHKRPVEPVEKSPIHYAPENPGCAAFRSVTPSGFASAFFEANP